MPKKLLIAYGLISPLNSGTIADLAEFDFVDTDWRIGPDIAAIRALNPSIKILFYKSGISAHPNMDDWAVVDANEDWFLHDTNNDRLQIEWPSGWYCTDPRSSGWQNHYATYIKDKLDTYDFDGIFADNAWPFFRRNVWTVDSGLTPDLNTGSPYTVWQTAMRELFTAVQTEIGSDLLIVNGNSDVYDDITDGRMTEDFGLRTPIDDVDDMAAAAAAGEIMFASPYTYVSEGYSNFLYSYCCYLLGMNPTYSYFSWLGYGGASGGYYSEMDYDFGDPLESYRNLGGSQYARKFQNAEVFVNIIDEIGTIVPTAEPPEPPVEPPPANYYRIVTSAETGGQVSPSGTHYKLLNQSFTVTATADTDYLFDHWVCNGITSYQDYTFTIPSAPPGATYYVTAYFQSNVPVEPDPPTPPETNYFSVNIGSSTGGSTDLTGEQTLLAGQTLTVYATPNDNYRFAYWLLDGSNWGTNRTFSLAGVADTSYTLRAVFSFVPPPPPNKPFIPPSTNVGKLSSGRLLAQVMKAQTKPKPIDFDDIFKKLKRMKV